MRKNRKWIAWLLIITIISLGLGGCKEGLDDEGRKIINIWHYWDDQESPFYQNIKMAIDDYQAEHPDLILSLHTLTEAEYRTKLSTSFTEGGGKDIDVFAFWGGYQTENLVNLDLLLPLDNYITDDVRQRVYQGGYGAFQNKNGKIYALPAYSWISTLYCNRELFEQYEVEIPKTLEELLAVSDTFSKANLTPLALGGKDGWQLNLLFESIALRMVGAGQISAFLNGQSDLADGLEFQTATERFTEFQSNGVLGKTPTASDAQTADDLFLHGEAAMRLTGSWLTDRMENMDDDEFVNKIEAIPFPAVMVDGQSYGSPSEHVGGYTHSFFVNNRTRHKNEAADICIYLSEVLGNTAEENGYGVSAWTREPAGKTALSRSLSQTTKEASTMQPSWDIFLEPQFVDDYVAAVADVFGGELSTLEFLNKLKQYVE